MVGDRELGDEKGALRPANPDFLDRAQRLPCFQRQLVVGNDAFSVFGRVEIAGGESQHLRARPADKQLECRIDEGEAPLQVLGIRRCRQVTHEERKMLLGFAGPLFRRQTRFAFARLFHGAQYRWRKAIQIGLKDIVGGAVPERRDRVFLADGARHEYERGAWANLSRNRKRFEAAEVREREVGEDHVRIEVLEFPPEVRLNVHGTRRKAQAGAAQLAQFQFGVSADVFDQQDTKLLVRVLRCCCHVSSVRCPVRRAGRVRNDPAGSCSSTTSRIQPATQFQETSRSPQASRCNC